MRHSSLLIKFCSVALICALAISFTACGSDKKKKNKEEKEQDVSSSETEATTTPPPTTTLPTFSGPMTNDVEISWQEDLYDTPTVKYVSCTDFINVRKGPGTDYDVVAKFENGMEVTIAGYTSNGWLKTTDGFYVSGDLMSTLPPQ